MTLVDISRALARRVDKLQFAPPVTHVYNPLTYAAAVHESYLRRFGSGHKRVVCLGMNPGPFGMVQTGVPFGDVSMVRDWMDIGGAVEQPKRQHPRRPIQGLACTRTEVSGTRLWGWARTRFGTPERFFKDFFVVNYCPLAFVEDSGRNRTPDKLPANEQARLFECCDEALRLTVNLLRPTFVVGIGAFATARARAVLGANSVTVTSILHPSPASPLANKDWAGTVERQLAAAGVPLPALQ